MLGILPDDISCPKTRPIVFLIYYVSDLLAVP